MSNFSSNLFKVCKKFFEVTKSSELNRTFVFYEGFNSFATVKAFIKKRGQHLQQLEFFYRRDIGKLLKIADRVCSELKTLNLYGPVDPATLEDLSSGALLPKLKDLSMMNQRFDSDTMSSLLNNRYSRLPQTQSI